MKAVILAGGLGTRLAEETSIKPKPMVEIGGKPMLWHIMNIYAAGGIKEFIIALGYKGEVIKEYFLNFYALDNDITVDLSDGSVAIQHRNQTDWKVHLIDTGLTSQTGGRFGRLRHLFAEDETFMATYGDGLANIDVAQLRAFHEAHGKQATVTTARPPARFGGVVFEGERVAEFTEKPQVGEGWVNAGYFVLHRRVLDLITDDSTIWEHEPLEQLARSGELMAYRHEGFWQPMDTLREKVMLHEMWESGQAPWKVWK
ncbi:glucose-1-phosphate cytidylyltransferase [Deinococcus aquaedulcis]|uniref:glucose-1-phosphate cytidylyltransferase n=1 Tax=Deinococcus aquaedulcis TaxID=2840455 RepID=UPI001C83BC2D|nr:glucose-1-phosphate cytidylyltransferase [Deinococcus aquaedulcis]